MGAGAVLALLLIVVGALLGSGGLVLAGVLTALVIAVQSVWSRFGLRSLEYERHLSATRVPWGERVELDLVVRNAKALPLPWLQIDDLVTHGADIADRHLTESAQRGVDVLRGTWSVGWFERVTRRFQIVGSRRGTYRFTAAELRVADLFARTTRSEERPLRTTYRVIPRIVSVRSALAQSPSVGATRAAKGLFEEPSLFAGVRPYQPGDPLRRIHWKATARVGRPVSRRYDPGREREVLIALDMQTMSEAWWMLNWDDAVVEGLCIAALSLARSFLLDGTAVGLAVNAFSDRPQRTVYLPPQRRARPGRGPSPTCWRMSAHIASVPFEGLLADVTRRAPRGLFGHRPECPGSGRIRPGPATPQRPGISSRATPPSDRTPASGPRGRGRRACPAPPIVSILTGRLPMRSNVSPDAVVAVLAPALWRLPGSPCVYVTVESLAGSGPAAPCPSSPSPAPPWSGWASRGPRGTTADRPTGPRSP